MDILTALRKPGNLEGELRNVYQWLSTALADAQAADLFSALANDEQSHLDLIKYQERIVRNSPKDFSDVEINLPVVDKTLGKIAEFRKTAPAVKDAIRFALDMETEVSEHYASTIMVQSNESLARLVEGLQSVQKDRHYEQLLEFARRYPA